jgi:hypothetical protein
MSAMIAVKDLHVRNAIAKIRSILSVFLSLK